MVTSSEKVTFVQFSQDEALKIISEIEKLFARSNGSEEFKNLFALKDAVVLEIND